MSQAAANPRNVVPMPTPNPELIRVLDGIRQEGFREHELLRARQMARKQQLPFLNDLDAVRVLRNAGYDLLPAPDKRDLLPPLMPAKSGADAEAIERLRDTSRNARNRKAAGAMRRFAFFVLAPTAAAAVYFTAVATPLFATYSEFVIQRHSQAAAGGDAGAYSGPGLPGSQDAIAVQGYLTSRAAFSEMNEQVDFAGHFSAAGIDLLHRLPQGASAEQAYSAFSRHVDVSFDPAEGILRMRVEAADPDVSRTISLTLLSLAEAHLDQMTAKLRRDQVSAATGARDRADQAVEDTQSRLIALQESFSVLSGDLEMNLLQEQIGRIEADLTEARLALQELEANQRPNRARIETTERRIRLLEGSLRQKRQRITDGSSSGVSIARAQAELAMLQSELATRQQVQTESILALERARSEAGRQARYLSLAVEPVLPDAPEWPRPLINTLMAFAAFFGIYMFASLSFSLIREQISK